METVCIKCKKNPVLVKRRGLCRRCYSLWYRQTGKQNAVNGIYRREVEFIKNFFTHNNWYYSPVIFRANGFRYIPDFYDNERNVFIEVVGTRQAFENNHKKYIKFGETFPCLKLEVRKISGDLIDLSDKRQSW